MTFRTKHIDVRNAGDMAAVKLHQVHPQNPFIYRIECQVAGCGNQVWPSQMLDVRAMLPEVTNGVSFACDGCVERWLRDPAIPLNIPNLMRAGGATETEILQWKNKKKQAAPNHIME